MPAASPVEEPTVPVGRRSYVLLHLPRLFHHCRRALCAVVDSRCHRGSDAQLLVSPPRALASLATTAGTGCAAVSSACSHHNEATRLGSQKKKGSPHDSGQRVLVQYTGWWWWWCGRDTHMQASSEFKTWAGASAPAPSAGLTSPKPYASCLREQVPASKKASTNHNATKKVVVCADLRHES